jgi:methylamine---glutamate N-methyltransferase subunit B
MQTIDLAATPLRELNAALQAQSRTTNRPVGDLNPRGAHASRWASTRRSRSRVRGSTGYYCAGMNKQATITVTATPGRAWPRT